MALRQYMTLCQYSTRVSSMAMARPRRFMSVIRPRIILYNGLLPATYDYQWDHEYKDTAMLGARLAINGITTRSKNTPHWAVYTIDYTRCSATANFDTKLVVQMLGKCR